MISLTGLGLGLSVLICAVTEWQKLVNVNQKLFSSGDNSQLKLI